MSQYEDFLQGKKLISADPPHDDGEKVFAQDAIRETPAPHGPITKKDAEFLVRLEMEPGWSILMGLVNDEIGRIENHAIELSQMDPIRNQREMQSAWMKVRGIKAAREIINGMIRKAVVKMKGDQAKEDLQ